MRKLTKKQGGGSMGDTTRANKPVPSDKRYTPPTPKKQSLTDKVKGVVTKVKEKIQERNKPSKPDAQPYSPKWERMKKGGAIKKKK